ncbi:MAG: hypothetical protein Q9227_004199 [Pyrenula ochraceoflavens]
MSAAERKREIEEKRARLAEIKRQREERQKEFAATRHSSNAQNATTKSTTKPDIGDFVASILEGSGRRTSGLISPAPRASSRPSSINSSDQLNGEDGTKPSQVSAATQTLSTTSFTTLFEVAPDPPPKRQVETYSKCVQTGPELYQAADEEENESFGSDADSTSRANKKLSRRERERDEQLRLNIRKEIEEELKATEDLAVDGPLPPLGAPRYPLRQLNTDELRAVTASDEFLSFIERSSKVIERALDEEYDVLADYTLSALNAEDEDDSVYARNSKKSYSLKQTLQLFDDRHSRKRAITDLQFSSHFPELLLSSHTKNAAAPNESAGLVLLWNAHSPSRPEYTFTATSDILSARFSPFHPNLVIGGSYSGQVLLWDTRISARTGAAVQKTPLSGTHLGHTHPVYSINVVGTPNAHNILTASTDGTVCSWAVDMLSQPQEVVELITPQPTRTEELAPTSITFPASDPTFFLVGTEEGSIYPCHRYARAGAKAGTDIRIAYRGHTAPVMSTQFHPARGPVDLSDFMLSSSLDWTVKLWRIRPAGASTSAAAAANSAPMTSGASGSAPQVFSPALDISREDIVYDVRWHPTRPGIFSCVLGSGDVEVFDLTIDSEVPVARTSPTRSAKAGTGLATGLNKCAWEEKAGRILAVGGLDGVVSLFEVGKGLQGDATGDEWLGVKRAVGRIETGRV